MDDVLIWCFEFFKARDEMNAKVHCSPVRWSPITVRVALALGIDSNVPGVEQVILDNQ